MSQARGARYRQGVDRRDPSERLWNSLKRLARSEARSLTQAEAIRRVKAAAVKEGALELPEPALRFYAQEYREMVSQNKKSG